MGKTTFHFSGNNGTLGIKVADTIRFLIMLKAFYKTEDMKEIERKLKRDIKKEPSYRKILSQFEYTTEEFTFGIVGVFPSMLNKSLINHLKKYVNEKKAKPIKKIMKKKTEKKEIKNVT